MKVVQLTRPALDPRRELMLRMRDAQGGLLDFTLSATPPAGWLAVELLEPDEPQARPLPGRVGRRA